MKKDVIQEQIGRNWADNYGMGGIRAVTGFGKTHTAFNYIIKPYLEKNPLRRVVILVHTVSLYNQWTEQLKKFDSKLQSNIAIYTIQYLQMNDAEFETSLLIVDEIDEFYSPNRMLYWDGTKIKRKHFLWLSATPEHKDNLHFKLFEIAPIIGEVKEEEATTYNWITKVEEHVIEVELTEDETVLYDELSSDIHRLMTLFDYDFPKIQLCLRGGLDKNGNPARAIDFCTSLALKFGWKPIYEKHLKNPPTGFSENDLQIIADIVSKYSPPKFFSYAKMIFKLIKARQKLLANSENKFEKIVEIIKDNTDKKIIVFNEDTEFLTRLYTRLISINLKVVQYHSGMPTVCIGTEHGKLNLLSQDNFSKTKDGKLKKYSGAFQRALAIEHMLDGTASIILTGKAADKGLDIPSLNMGIIGSNTSNQNTYIQRKGRISRYLQSKDAHLYNIVCTKTREPEKLKKLTNKIKEFNLELQL